MQKSYRYKFSVIFLLAIFCLITIFSLLLNANWADWTTDLFFQLRGARSFGEAIALVFISAEDVQALGGWPITRDYYGYLTHILQQAGARVIGFDLLFSEPDLRFPEHDQSLATFFETSQNIVLPFVFKEVESANGREPIFPFPAMNNAASTIGFSNLGEDSRRVPLFLRHDSLNFSFGLQLARLFLSGSTGQIRQVPSGLELSATDGRTWRIPLEGKNQLRLNHFGDPGQIQAVSLLDVIQSTASDSLNFRNKIVIVAATAPGLATLKATPFTPALPASLLHATVAENIIRQNYLRISGVGWQMLLWGLLLAGLWGLNRISVPGVRISSSLGLLILVVGFAFALFSRANLILPIMPPFIGGLLALIGLEVERTRWKQQLNSSRQSRLQQQLERAQNQLTELQKNLARQTRENAEITTRTREEIQTQAQRVMELENQLRDLAVFEAPSEPVPIDSFEIIHSSESPMTGVIELIHKIGADTIPVLIIGETGTGKELVARAIHQRSPRRGKPFVSINCGALAENLLESELFGHEKGSFTGANSRRRGRFELATGGTIFLDEITETTPAFQIKLLRVLQEGTFERLGGESSLQVDVRVLAATNRDIEAELSHGNFRADLFYRLNGFQIKLPPLRERIADISLLAKHFLKKYASQTVTGFSAAAMDLLQNYRWPGNVRELENLVRRAAILADGEQRRLIQTRDFPPQMLESLNTPDLAAQYQSLEVQILESLRALKFARSAISQTARVLGNRDRGTITEYFRGLCFEQLVKHDFDVSRAAVEIAGNQKLVSRAQAKIEEYLEKLKPHVNSDGDKLQSVFKGLPKKYHPYLEEVIAHLQREH